MPSSVGMASCAAIPRETTTVRARDWGDGDRHPHVPEKTGSTSSCLYTPCRQKGRRPNSTRLRRWRRGRRRRAARRRPQSAFASKKMSQREWLLQRPDTFIGSVEVAPLVLPLFHETGGKVGTLTCTYETLRASPALRSLANELVTNALDAGQRTTAPEDPLRQRSISISWVPGSDARSGHLVVVNDGPTLAIAWNAQHGLYDPQIAFGEFQAGTNFDDSMERFTAGRNGVGSQGANVYATRFRVRIHSVVDGKLYEQTWTSNMARHSAARIVASKRKSNETLVEWTPDATRLGGTSGIEEAMPALARWLAFNASLCAAPSVRVTLDGVPIGARTPEHFCRALGGSGRWRPTP